MAEKRGPPTDDELRFMGRMAAHLIKMVGKVEYLDRATPCKIARVTGLTLCQHSDGITIRQDTSPHVLVYAEDPNGEPEGCEPLLLLYYKAELQKRYPLDSLTVI